MTLDSMERFVSAFVMAILGMWMLALLVFAVWIILTQPLAIRSC